jgi:hypothetical protein
MPRDRKQPTTGCIAIAFGGRARGSGRRDGTPVPICARRAGRKSGFVRMRDRWRQTGSALPARDRRPVRRNPRQALRDAHPEAAPIANVPTSLPSGTVTLLFTNIEGSTPLTQRLPDAIKVALARQYAILKRAIAAFGGRVFNFVGDAFCGAFMLAASAACAAIAARRAPAAGARAARAHLPVRRAGRIKPAQRALRRYQALTRDANAMHWGAPWRTCCRGRWTRHAARRRTRSVRSMLR